MKQNSKPKFLSSPLSREQWLGLLLLAVLFLLFFAAMALYDRRHPQPEPVADETTTDAQHYADSIAEVRALRQQQRLQWEQERAERERDRNVPVHLHRFDPNTADSAEYRTLGFPAWMARSAEQYRKAGATFRVKTDMNRLYGMNDSIYRVLQPYIDLPDTLPTPPQDTIPAFVLHFAVKKDTILELNTCDTAELKLLHGIGTYTAIQITQYRNKLGGYHSIDQLREITAVSLNIDSLASHFTVDTTLIQTIPVNHASVGRLQYHPYLRFEQAKALYEFRRTRFKLDSLAQLKSLDEFNDTDLIRLKPYLNFDR